MLSEDHNAIGFKIIVFWCSSIVHLREAKRDIGMEKNRKTLLFWIV